MAAHNNYVIFMPNITLSIPEETKKRMDKHPHMKWSRAIRAIIERELDKFEETERLAKKGGLKIEDFKEISEKIDKATRKHARKLLNESYNRR